MILRRIAAHLRDQNWGAIGIDFAIVVIGVFVGIQASNLNADRAERRLERDYRERLVGDLDTIIGNAEQQVEFERHKALQVREALALAAAASTEDAVARLGHALVVISARRTPSFESPTFNDLQSSGRLNLVQDSALRRDLSTYFARLQYLRGAIQRNNDTLAEPFREYLRTENIGSGFMTDGEVEGVTMTLTEREIARLWIRHFGPRDSRGTGAKLRLPAAAPFWEGLRANLSWRGQGAVANENLLMKIVSDARTMRSKITAG